MKLVPVDVPMVAKGPGIETEVEVAEPVTMGGKSGRYPLGNGGGASRPATVRSRYGARSMEYVVAPGDGSQLTPVPHASSEADSEAGGGGIEAGAVAHRVPSA